MYTTVRCYTGTRSPGKAAQPSLSDEFAVDSPGPLAQFQLKKRKKFEQI